MRFSEMKSEALKSLKNYWAISSLLVFTLFLIVEGIPDLYEIQVTGSAGTWLYDTLYANPMPGSVRLVETLYGILTAPLSFAFSWFFLDLIRHQKPLFKQVFTVYQNFKLTVKLIWVSLVMGFFILLWLLLLVIPGLVKILAYSQTYYILKDHPEYSATEAITASRRLMKGHKWNFFVFGLSFIGWAILAAIPLFIGYLWLVPYFSAAVAVYYQNLTDQSTNNDVLEIKPPAKSDPS